jgi:hypothetical protein
VLREGYIVNRKLRGIFAAGEDLTGRWRKLHIEGTS